MTIDPQRVPPEWDRWAEFNDGSVLNLTNLSADLAVDVVRAHIREGRLLTNTFHVVRDDREAQLARDDRRTQLLHELAVLFIYERVRSRTLSSAARAELVTRMVGAMRQAIDQELEAIAREVVDSEPSTPNPQEAP